MQTYIWYVMTDDYHVPFRKKDWWSLVGIQTYNLLVASLYINMINVDMSVQVFVHLVRRCRSS